MLSLPKSLVVGCISLLLPGTASIKGAPQGFMEGHLKILSLKAVEPSDNMPRPEVAPETYAECPLIILSQGDKKERAYVTADQNGNYRVALPPGAYILDVRDRAAKHIHATPHPFTVISNQTVRVDMNIVIGFRASPLSVR
jgi:hypothetical protein